jgi:hypothetical protein
VAILHAEKRRRDGLGVAAAQNPRLAAAFPPADKLFWITHGGCSCDLNLSKHPDSGERTLAKERARYRKKGWSEAKVDRAMAAKHSARPSVSRGQREDTPIEKLTDLLNRLSRVAGGVRIVTHQYSGAVDEEVVTVGHGKASTVQAILEVGLPADLVVDLTEGAG